MPFTEITQILLRVLLAVKSHMLFTHINDRRLMQACKQAN